MQPVLTAVESVTINQIVLSLKVLKDRQQFSDAEGDAEALGISSATWALFGTIWPVARVLAALVEDMDLQGKRVLEIGCGIGLASLVLHHMGVDITASDYHPLAGDFLRSNAKRNALPLIKYATGNWETENPALGSFDLIIGSDVLYEPAHVQNVSGFIDRHCLSGGRAIIVDPGRANRARFTKAMQALDFDHHFSRFEHMHEDDPVCRGRVLHFHKAGLRA